MTKKPYDEPVSHEKQSRTMSGLTSLLWMFVGAVIAFMFMFFLYLSPLFDGFKTEVEVNRPTTVQPIPQELATQNYEYDDVLSKREFQAADSMVKDKSALAESPDIVSVKVVKPELVPNTKNLPESVDVAGLPEAPETSHETSDEAKISVVEENATYDGDDDDGGGGSIKISSTPVSYILQIRSYDNPEEADKKRAEVMMAGVDAQIVKRIDNGVQIYQVVSSVMNSKQEVIRASKRLSDNGIDSLIVEQKR